MDVNENIFYIYMGISPELMVIETSKKDRFKGYIFYYLLSVLLLKISSKQFFINNFYNQILFVYKGQTAKSVYIYLHIEDCKCFINNFL